MYILGKVSARVPQMQGTEVILTDEKRFVLRFTDNRIRPLEREEVVKLLQGTAVDWSSPDVPAQVTAFLHQQVEQERQDQERQASAAAAAASIRAEGELDGLRALVRGRTVLRMALIATIVLGLALGTWGILDKPEPPRRAEAQVAEGHLLASGLPELGTASYAVGAEIAPRITGYLTDTRGVVKTSSLEIVENLLLSPQTSSIPLHMRPLGFQGSGYRQMPVAVDQSLGNFAVYADNPYNQDPNFYTIRYVEVSTMQTRELVSGERVMEKRKEENDTDEIENWDTVSPTGYAIDDHRVIITALYSNTSPAGRNSRLLWYNTAGVEGGNFAISELDPVEVDAGNASFKDTPLVSRDPAGKGYWVAYLSHPDNNDQTADGRIRVVHAFDDKALNSPPPTAAFYVDQLFGRKPDAAGTVQSSPHLLGNRLAFVEGGQVYVVDLGQVSIAGIGEPDAQGGYPGGYELKAIQPRAVAAAGALPPRLLRDYKGNYHAIIVDSNQRILAYPEAGGEPVVLCESAAEKTYVSTFRSHVVWLQRGEGGMELRENAVVPAAATVILGGPAPSVEASASVPSSGTTEATPTP